MTFEGKICSSEILCVGTELLIGSTLNTNSNYLSKRLCEMGIPLYRHITVGDNPDRLLAQLEECAERSDLVILTGGLGPTKDDITMEYAARLCGRELVFDQESYDRLCSYFTRTGKKMTENNKKQAMMPYGSTVLYNDNGTAPGAVFEYFSKNSSHICILALLPGPPSEMSLMFDTKLAPLLQDFAPLTLKNRYIHIVGVGESSAETIIEDLMDEQSNPTIAPYATEGECMFRVTQTIFSPNDPDLLTPVVEEIKQRFGVAIYEIGDRTLPMVLVDLLRERNLKIAFAESCTGGMISSGIVDVPGSSDVFLGGVISYSNEIKHNVLGVSSEILEKYKAVSSECAIAMAQGVRKLTGADIAVSVTGVAGPDGGTPSKPVGTVWLGIADMKGSRSYLLNLSGKRTRIRKNAANKAYNLIRLSILCDDDIDAKKL